MKAAVRTARALPAFLSAASALVMGPAVAIESQTLDIAALLSAQVRQVFGCGEWSASGSSGYYRIVVVQLHYGDGTEVYVQRVQGSEAPKVLETTPIRELNDDHAEYSVSSARCVAAGRRSSVELMATFEHDEGDVTHRIRISLEGPGSYRVRDVVVRPRPSGKKP